MKAVIEIMESETKPLYFVTIKIPKRNTEDGPEVHTFYYDTHLAIQIPLDFKPTVKYVGEPGRDNIEDKMFGASDLEDFMGSIEMEPGLEEHHMRCEKCGYTWWEVDDYREELEEESN